MKKHNKKSRPAVPGASLTVDEFCAKEQIARATFYRLLRQGKLRGFYRIGNHLRITPEAAQANREAGAA